MTALLNKRQLVVIGLSFIILFYFFSLPLGQRRLPSFVEPNPYPADVLEVRREKIIEAFQHAWKGYTEHCFGRDTLHPVSNTCEDDFGGWGATAIDSLSTAILFEQRAAVEQILKFIGTIDFQASPKQGDNVQLFETTIRHFAAMISGWDLLHGDGPFNHLVEDPYLLQTLHKQMTSLGDVLSCAFHTPSGVPSEWVNPTRCGPDGGPQNSLAGAGTIILEFARLADITGNRTYADIAERAQNHLMEPQGEGEPFPGLLGSHVDLDDGKIHDSGGSWGAMADSYYEYLIKGYLYNSDKYAKYLERWLTAADSTMRFIGSHPYGHPEWTMLSTWSGRTSLHNTMESLAWFAGGSLIYGGMVVNNQSIVNYGLSIADAAGETYRMTRTGLGGEFVTWSSSCEPDEDNACDPKDAIKLTNGNFRLRPEVLETWYYAYRATRDAKYLEWSWSAFEKINLYCRTSTGFSAIKDVNAEDGGGPTDVQESFVFAEVMKYVYLTHLDDKKATFQVQDSRTGAKNTWVYNTEAHPLRVAGTPR